MRAAGLGMARDDDYQPEAPLAALALDGAQAGARTFSSGADPMQLLAEGLCIADAVVVLLSSFIAFGLRNGLTGMP
jgi:hypothetical protein